jgi:E3 ubiquitin-protein ligase RNF115/126
MASGRMGDYVFTQEALDALMTQLMEGGQHAARPASQETRDALPRHTVSAGSELRTRDCAVCKDGFEVGQKTVALPCSHSFHEEYVFQSISYCIY